MKDVCIAPEVLEKSKLFFQNMASFVSASLALFYGL